MKTQKNSDDIKIAMTLNLFRDIVDRIQFFTHRSSDKSLYAGFTAKSLTIFPTSLGWGVALLHW